MHSALRPLVAVFVAAALHLAALVAPVATPLAPLCAQGQQRAETLVATAHGMTLQIPREAVRYDNTRTGAVAWTLECGDGCTLAVMANGSAWDGTSASLLAYADHLISRYQEKHPGAHLVSPAWSSSAEGAAYVSCGGAWEGGLMVAALLPTGPNRVGTVTVDIRGTVGEDSRQAARDILDGMGVAPTAATDPVSLLGVEPASLPALLESQGLSYTELPECGGGAWTKGLDGAFYGASALAVSFTGHNDGSGSSPQMTKSQLQSALPASGAQVEWLGASVPWDEPPDVLAELRRALHLGEAHESGYTSGWDEDGSYSWAAIGAFELGGRPGFWTLTVAMHGGAGTVTLSADFFDNGYLSDTSLDELAAAIW